MMHPQPLSSVCLWLPQVCLVCVPRVWLSWLACGGSVNRDNHESRVDLGCYPGGCYPVTTFGNNPAPETTLGGELDVCGAALLRRYHLEFRELLNEGRYHVHTQI